MSASLAGKISPSYNDTRPTIEHNLIPWKWYFNYQCSGITLLIRHTVPLLTISLANLFISSLSGFCNEISLLLCILCFYSHPLRFSLQSRKRMPIMTKVENYIVKL
jgi:hypothetical protein